VPDFRGHVATFDLAKHSEVSHVNMEKDGAIQAQVMNKILELAETPAKAESQSVPIHYVVPADAAIELWDSGRSVTARSGDSLETLAAAYHVPLWSLTQANHLPDGTPLAVGTHTCRVTSVRSPCRRASKLQGKNAPPAQLAELQK
jgi:hypothetical protein